MEKFELLICKRKLTKREKFLILILGFLILEILIFRNLYQPLENEISAFKSQIEINKETLEEPIKVEKEEKITYKSDKPINNIIDGNLISISSINNMGDLNKIVANYKGNEKQLIALFEDLGNRLRVVNLKTTKVGLEGNFLIITNEKFNNTYKKSENLSDENTKNINLKEIYFKDSKIQSKPVNQIKVKASSLNLNKEKVKNYNKSDKNIDLEKNKVKKEKNKTNEIVENKKPPLVSEEPLKEKDPIEVTQYGTNLDFINNMNIVSYNPNFMFDNRYVDVIFNDLKDQRGRFFIEFYTGNQMGKFGLIKEGQRYEISEKYKNFELNSLLFENEDEIEGFYYEIPIEEKDPNSFSIERYGYEK